MVDSLLGFVLAHVASRCSGQAVVVTGAVGQGKTTAVLHVAEGLRRAGCAVGGIAAPRVIVAGQTIGYDALDLASGQRTALARNEPPGEAVGCYYLRPDGLSFADAAIRSAAATAQVVIVDEVGPAELSRGGHYPAVAAALRGSALPVLVVRLALVSEVQAAFGLPSPAVFALPVGAAVPSGKGFVGAKAKL